MRHCPSIGLGLGLSLRSTGFGVSYTREGRVLDYSTGVGPFTIVDQSGEGNTATLYSGRGLTIDAGSNTVVYDTNYTSASRTAAVWMRVSGLGARTLNGATGTFTFTPTATNTWEQISSTATVTGDLTWTAGSNCDIGDLTCATEHWTHNDWSDPTGDTSNGKLIVDSGPNKYHGTATGCSGFTGEATIPQTADKNWNKYQCFNGTDTKVDCGTLDVTAYTSIEVNTSFATSLPVGNLEFMLSLSHSSSDDIRLLINTGGYLIAAVDSGVAYSINFGLGYNDGKKHTVNFILNGSGLSGTVDGINPQSNGSASFDFSTAAGSLCFGQRFNGTSGYGTGTLFGINISNQSGVQHAWSGLGNYPWKDTVGTKDGTESGAFTRELVTASDANDQIDALGTAILEPRLNTQQLNPFGEGEYSLTPDSASLDLTTAATWELWGDFYGTVSSFETLFSKYIDAGNRSWALQKTNTHAADELRLLIWGANSAVFVPVFSGITDGVGSLTITLDQTDGILAYWNASPLTVSAHTQVPIVVTTAPVELGASTVLDQYSSLKIGSAKIYNTALTAAEVLTNYNTQKSLYGL